MSAAKSAESSSAANEPTPSAFEFEDIRIEVPWGHVVGRWYGNRQVRPILALHGWLDNLGTWDTLIPLLPAHVGVLCIDLPGHGRSSKYPPGVIYHVVHYVHIIQRIMKEYNWHKVSLMGHSMGSIICFLYVSMYPRTVDMMIAIDVVQPVESPHELSINRMAYNIEKCLVEDERQKKLAWQEPPAYPYEQLEDILYKGSERSVEKWNSKYILNRSITKSQKYPDKYYFSRDGRVKYYTVFPGIPEFSKELARRIRNVPYLVVKGSESPYLNETSYEIMDILREQNAHFEFHICQGSHHVHLNNPREVAAVLSAFIHRHRPAVVHTWAVDDKDEEGEELKDPTLRARRRNKRQKWLSGKWLTKSKL